MKLGHNRHLLLLGLSSALLLLLVLGTAWALSKIR
jgi:hypothetical protein